MQESLTATLAEWAAELRFDDIPSHTVEVACSQLISNLAAVRASMTHPLGRRIVAAFGSPTQADSKQACYVLAALAAALDFDEVAFSGHVSTGAVNVAVGYANARRLDGRALLTAIVAANEVAARITATTILGPFFRGQTNTHCHLASAAAARLKTARATVETWTDGLSLALSVLPTPLHHGMIAGDGKSTAAAVPVRMALDACDAAEAGLHGARNILEDDEGLLPHLSTVPLPNAITEGLGRRWHTDTLTFKRYPGSAYLHAAFECAERLYSRVGPVDPDSIRAVTVHASALTWQLEQKVARYLAGPATNTAAATLSVGYGVAVLLLHGRLAAADFASDALADKQRWRLAEKVRVEHDMTLTEQMAAATSPLGEALRLAGPRVTDYAPLRPWVGADVRGRLAELGAAAEDFVHATMSIGARVEVQMVSGEFETEECRSPLGSAGPYTRLRHREIVADKFAGVGGPADLVEDLGIIATATAAEVSSTLYRAIGVPPQ